jgi:hypothetical protein
MNGEEQVAARRRRTRAGVWEAGEFAKPLAIPRFTPVKMDRYKRPVRSHQLGRFSQPQAVRFHSSHHLNPTPLPNRVPPVGGTLNGDISIVVSWGHF